MSLVWFVTLLTYRITAGEVPALFWLILVPFGIQDLWDSGAKAFAGRKPLTSSDPEYPPRSEV